MEARQGDAALTKLQKQPTTLVGLDSEKRRQFFAQFSDQFEAVADSIRPERIVQLAVLATANPAIAQCDIKTVVGAMMEAVTLGFEPVSGLNQCALIPYNDKKNNRKVLQLQIMYQGLIDLAYKSGLVRDIYGDVVREGDLLDYEKGTEGYIKHVTEGPWDAQITHAYTVAHLNNGGTVFEIWPIQKIIAHRNHYARGYERSDSPWVTAFDSMCMKTVLKQMMKFLPKSVKFRKAESVDERVIEYDYRRQSLSYETFNDTVEDPINTEKKEVENDQGADN